MKAKIRLTIEWEYETKPEDYRGLNLETDEERLNYDVSSVKNDPWAMLESGDWSVKEVTGELVEEESK